MSGAGNSWRPAPGCFIKSPYGNAKVLAILDRELFACETLDTLEVRKVGLGDIQPLQVPIPESPIEDQFDLSEYTDAEIEAAKKVYEALKPFLGLQRNKRSEIEAAAASLGVTAVTAYKYINRYRESGKLTAFIPRKRGRKIGFSTLSIEQNLIIDDVITNFHFTAEAPVVTETYKELTSRCRHEGLALPHINTLRDKISVAAHGNSRARLRNNKPFDVSHRLSMGDGEVASAPRQAVMIDHTPADITMVSDDDRTPIGRPTLTFCIDVFSRLITGYHAGFEPAGTISVALAVQMTVLPKKDLLDQYGIKAEWPASGLFDTLYTDNAMEFRSTTLGRACSQYGIDIVQRPIGLPHIHGIIERNFQSQNTAIHGVKGTTKSNVQDKGAYDSEKNAILTVSEFNEWLAFKVIEFNHSKHRGINGVPYRTYKDGLLGNESQPGAGAPRLPNDFNRFFTDFLPYKEAQVKSYGIVWDYITYRDDALKPWVNALDPKTQKPRKFIVRRDPRDLSKIHFWDPDLKRYFVIRWKDLRRPIVTKWEWEQARKDARSQPERQVDEEVIFDCYEARKRITNAAQKETKKAKRNQAIKNRLAENPIMPQQETPPIDHHPAPTAAEDEWDFDDLDSFEVTR